MNGAGGNGGSSYTTSNGGYSKTSSYDHFDDSVWGFELADIGQRLIYM